MSQVLHKNIIVWGLFSVVWYRCCHLGFWICCEVLFPRTFRSTRRYNQVWAELPGTKNSVL